MEKDEYVLDASTRFLAQPPDVVLVPGEVNPSEISYGPLIEVIRERARIALKDLELYITDTPAQEYGLETEIEGIRRFVDAAGLRAFHLVGYSGGGAVALAFASAYPERLKSLALVEPTWVGSRHWSLEDSNYWSEIARILDLPREERRRAYDQEQVQPALERALETSLDWERGHYNNLQRLHQAFKSYELDYEQLRRFQQPVYLAIGSLSDPIERRKAMVLADLLPDIHVEIYEGLHHFNPPHQAEPERFASVLYDLWSQGEMCVLVDA